MTQVRFEFSQIDVTTVSGWYGSDIQNHKGLYFRTQYQNIQERGPADTVEWIIDGEPAPPKLMPYS